MPVVHDLSSFVSRALVVTCALLLGAAVEGLRPAGAAGQTATVRVEENLRAAPNDVILGVLSPGSTFAVVDRRPGWLQVELDGWMWIRSLQMVDRDGFDLVVVPEEPDAGGENLRTRPAGPVTVRLVRGALLSEVERIPGWVRVRRRAWVWERSVDIDEAGGAGRDATPVERSAPTGMPGAELVRAGSRGAPVLATPDGDTLARVVAGADLTVLARQGSWARVRVDGWVWMPDTARIEGAADAPAGPATPDAVAADPVSWRGRIVTWTLQFISMERAEAVRTDFYEGEPFLLARPVAGSEVPFVYVALPPGLLDEAEGLRPLERITVRGRIRVGASALTGSPIVDLEELRRGGGP
jgi:hypothetical protein